MRAQRTQLDDHIFCAADAGKRSWALDTSEGWELERGYTGTELGARRWAQRHANTLGLSLYLWPLGEPNARGIDIEPRQERR